ncbi:hypothetical protein FQR65_LT08872 [Abscondita terminalis]|nr:hypothetical protein FQR65_LT08872 [Abscondita terminalis]
MKTSYYGGRKKFSYQNLEAMTNEEYMRLFEDIPATIESDLEDMSDNDIAEDTAEIEQVNEMWDINAMDVDFLDDFESVERVEQLNPQPSVDSMEKSEDDLTVKTTSAWQN